MSVLVLSALVGCLSLAIPIGLEIYVSVQKHRRRKAFDEMINLSEEMGLYEDEFKTPAVHDNTKDA